MLKELKPKFEAQGKLIDIINEVDYGTMNGEKVLKLAIKLIKSKQA